MDLGARDPSAGPEATEGGHRRSNGYSEECLDRLEPNGNIPKDGSLHRGQCRRGRGADGRGGEGGEIKVGMGQEGYTICRYKMGMVSFHCDMCKRSTKKEMMML